MATFVLAGQTTWLLNRDSEGHREYRITYQVGADSPLVGPMAVLETPGLPVPNSTWNVDGDIDLAAVCRWDAEVKPRISNEPNTLWDVTFVFSTKLPDSKTCKDFQFDNPLLEPAKISGAFNKYTEEATVDRFANPLINSAWELLRGPQIEFDRNRMSIKIEQNVPTIFQAATLPAAMIDTVNTAPLWGFPARCVKLSSAPWERKFQGACLVYYTRTLEFDINTETFDRDVLDEGTKALNGHYNAQQQYVLDRIGGNLPDPGNPAHFKRYQDADGNPSRVVLDGHGLPFGVTVPDVDPIDIGCVPSASLGLLAQVYGFTDADNAGVPFPFRQADGTPFPGCRQSPPRVYPVFRLQWDGTKYTGNLRSMSRTSSTPPGRFLLLDNYDRGNVVEFTCTAPADVRPGAAGHCGGMTLTCELCVAGVNPTGLAEFVSCTSSPPSWTFKLPFSVPEEVTIHNPGCLGDALIRITAPANRSPGMFHVERYPESNFLLLGIPLIF